jgi:tRNA (cytidine/uridine-2'-O-)-methyltransferase
MDYWPRLKLTVHDDDAAFFQAMSATRLWFLTSKSSSGIWDARFADGDCLVLGSETHGLPESLVHQHQECAIRIPQSEGERCLNLSTAAGIALFEALRQIQTS